MTTNEKTTNEALSTFATNSPKKAKVTWEGNRDAEGKEEKTSGDEGDRRERRTRRKEERTRKESLDPGERSIWRRRRRRRKKRRYRLGNEDEP